MNQHKAKQVNINQYHKQAKKKLTIQETARTSDRQGVSLLQSAPGLQRILALGAAMGFVSQAGETPSVLARGVALGVVASCFLFRAYMRGPVDHRLES